MVYTLFSILKDKKPIHVETNISNGYTQYNGLVKGGFCS